MGHALHAAAAGASVLIGHALHAAAAGLVGVGQNLRSSKALKK